MPSKAPILMACRRVIVNSVEINTQYAEMFKQNNIGVSVDISDYDGLADAVTYLYNSPNELKKMAENAYTFGKANYSSTQSTAKLIKILKSYGERKSR